MVNPAEDIVNVWLQECRNHFTMSNVVVPKTRRRVENKEVWGGRGKEIDLLSVDVHTNRYYWTEVSVSPSPYLPSKDKKHDELVKNAVGKFSKEKEEYIFNRFGVKNIEKWYVYSPRLFSKKSNEKKLFLKDLESRGITGKDFCDILEELHKKLNYVGYDMTRNYLYLLKKFSDFKK